MKCITLTQPWATLVAIGAKRTETRSWATRYRGPLAIHAAAGYGKGGRRGWYGRCNHEPFRSVLAPHIVVPHTEQYNPYFMPMGAIVAVCQLVDCVPIVYEWPRNQVVSIASRHRLTDQERAFGDYSPGRFAWLLANVRQLAQPIPCKGQLGLWEYTGTIE